MEDSEKMLDVAEPTPEVAEESTDVVETPQEFSDGEVKEDSQENVDSNKEDTKENAENSKETPKEEQSLEERAKFAEQRRFNEKLEVEKQKAYEQGRLEAYKGKVNPYTNKPIQDIADIEMYETMFALEESGKDPINDLPEELANKRREEERIRKEKIELEETTKRELDEFEKKYPDVNVSELLGNEFFMDYIQGKNKPITELYEGFTNLKNSFRNSAINVAKTTIANAQASPGALGSEADVTVDYANMSREEFLKNVERVKNGELR